jgi:hypothetical protein
LCYEKVAPTFPEKLIKRDVKPTFLENIYLFIFLQPITTQVIKGDFSLSGKSGV